MLPAVAGIHGKDVVENHRAEPQNQELLGVSYAERRVISIVLEGFPAGTVFIAQGSDVVGKDVAEKSQFESFVQSVGRNDHVASTMQQQGMAAPRIYVELQQGKRKSDKPNAAEHDEATRMFRWPGNRVLQRRPASRLSPVRSSEKREAESVRVQCVAIQPWVDSIPAKDCRKLHNCHPFYRCLPYRWIVFIDENEDPECRDIGAPVKRFTLIPAVSIHMAKLLLAAWKISPGRMEPVISAIAGENHTQQGCWRDPEKRVVKHSEHCAHKQAANNRMKAVSKAMKQQSAEGELFTDCRKDRHENIRLPHGQAGRRHLTAQLPQKFGRESE